MSFSLWPTSIDPDVEAIFELGNSWIYLGNQIYQGWSSTVGPSFENSVNWSGYARNIAEEVYVEVSNLFVSVDQNSPGAAKTCWTMGEMINQYGIQMQQAIKDQQSANLQAFIGTIIAVLTTLVSFGVLDLGVLGTIFGAITNIASKLASWLANLLKITGTILGNVLTGLGALVDAAAVQVATDFGTIDFTNAVTGNNQQITPLGEVEGFVMGLGIGGLTHIATSFLPGGLHPSNGVHTPKGPDVSNVGSRVPVNVPQIPDTIDRSPLGIDPNSPNFLADPMPNGPVIDKVGTFDQPPTNTPGSRPFTEGRIGSDTATSDTVGNPVTGNTSDGSRLTSTTENPLATPVQRDMTTANGESALVTNRGVTEPNGVTTPSSSERVRSTNDQLTSSESTATVAPDSARVVTPRDDLGQSSRSASETGVSQGEPTASSAPVSRFREPGAVDGPTGQRGAPTSSESARTSSVDEGVSAGAPDSESRAVEVSRTATDQHRPEPSTASEGEPTPTTSQNEGVSVLRAGRDVTADGSSAHGESSRPDRVDGELADVRRQIEANEVSLRDTSEFGKWTADRRTVDHWLGLESDSDVGGLSGDHVDVNRIDAEIRTAAEHVVDLKNDLRAVEAERNTHQGETSNAMSETIFRNMKDSLNDQIRLEESRTAGLRSVKVDGLRRELEVLQKREQALAHGESPGPDRGAGESAGGTSHGPGQGETSRGAGPTSADHGVGQRHGESGPVSSSRVEFKPPLPRSGKVFVIAKNDRPIKLTLADRTTVVLARDNEVVRRGNHTGEPVVYREVVAADGSRLPNPRTFVRNPDSHEEGHVVETTPVSSPKYEAWLARANRDVATARILDDIASRVDELAALDRSGLRDLLRSNKIEDVNAAIWEVVRRAPGGKMLRWPQVKAATALSEGKIVNMAAGEGKSLVYFFDAVRRSLRGDTDALHVISTRGNLSDREFATYHHMLDGLGFNVSRVKPENGPSVDDSGQPNIYLLTSEDNAFTILMHGAMPGQAASGDKRIGASIDEIDEAFVYSNTLYILSEGSHLPAPRAIRNEVIFYRDFLTKSLGRSDLTEADFGREPGQFGGPAVLTDAGKARADALLGRKLDENGLNRLNMAAAARWEYKEHIHYEVHDRGIVIINQTTHEPLRNPETSTESRWNGGLAQAIEANHNLTIRNDPVSNHSITAERLYSNKNYKQHVVGASGTALGKGERYAKIGLSPDIVDIPRYYESRLNRVPDHVSPDMKTKIITIARDVKEMRLKTNRPQVIIVHRNDLVTDVSHELTTLGVPHEAIDAKWILRKGTDHVAAFQDVIDRAGESGNVLVINMTGARGVDIPLSAKAREAGGLHVVLTARSEVSHDIDVQAENRAGRSGDPGSVKYYISPEDDLFRLSRNPKVQLAVIRYVNALKEVGAGPTERTGAELGLAENGLRAQVGPAQADAARRLGMDIPITKLPNAPPTTATGPTTSPTSLPITLGPETPPPDQVTPGDQAAPGPSASRVDIATAVDPQQHSQHSAGGTSQTVTGRDASATHSTADELRITPHASENGTHPTTAVLPGADPHAPVRNSTSQSDALVAQAVAGPVEPRTAVGVFNGEMAGHMLIVGGRGYTPEAFVRELLPGAGASVGAQRLMVLAAAGASGPFADEVVRLAGVAVVAPTGDVVQEVSGRVLAGDVVVDGPGENGMTLRVGANGWRLHRTAGATEELGSDLAEVLTDLGLVLPVGASQARVSLRNSLVRAEAGTVATDSVAGRVMPGSVSRLVRERAERVVGQAWQLWDEVNVVADMVAGLVVDESAREKAGLAAERRSDFVVRYEREVFGELNVRRLEQLAEAAAVMDRLEGEPQVAQRVRTAIRAARAAAEKSVRQLPQRQVLDWQGAWWRSDWAVDWRVADRIADQGATGEDRLMAAVEARARQQVVLAVAGEVADRVTELTTQIRAAAEADNRAALDRLEKILLGEQHEEQRWRPLLRTVHELEMARAASALVAAPENVALVEEIRQRAGEAFVRLPAKRVGLEVPAEVVPGWGVAVPAGWYYPSGEDSVLDWWGAMAWAASGEWFQVLAHRDPILDGVRVSEAPNHHLPFRAFAERVAALPKEVRGDRPVIPMVCGSDRKTQEDTPGTLADELRSILRAAVLGIGGLLWEGKEIVVGEWDVDPANGRVKRPAAGERALPPEDGLFYHPADGSAPVAMGADLPKALLALSSGESSGWLRPPNLPVPMPWIAADTSI